MHLSELVLVWILDFKYILHYILYTSIISRPSTSIAVLQSVPMMYLACIPYLQGPLFHAPMQTKMLVPHRTLGVTLQIWSSHMGTVTLSHTVKLSGMRIDLLPEIGWSAGKYLQCQSYDQVM